MLKDNNILFTLLAIVPALLYVFVLIKHLPNNVEIKTKTIIKYLIAGISSAVSVLVFHGIFPNWGNAVQPDNLIYSIWFFSFIQVAFLEEIFKFSWFKTSELDNSVQLQPIQAFFYCVLTGVGFAIAENFLYLLNHGPEVLFWRNITAVLCHLTNGIIMGYFVAIGIHKKQKIEYSMLGILCATICHGLYDFNLFIGHFLPHLNSQTQAFVFLVVLIYLFLVISSKMVKHLNKLEANKKIIQEEKEDKNNPIHLD